ncbi:rhombotarget lipoprotein [Thermodesulfobacteriota bacterium]
MRYRSIMAICLIVSIAFIGSCTTSPPKPYKHYKTNILRFLSPDENDIKLKEAMEPTVTVPLKAGIAFTPSLDYGEGFPEKERMNLMQKIASQFKEYKFVESIELIPSLYLEEGGGFSNLDKLRQLFGIDVIMLLSYDQSQFKDTGALSIAYWTLIGAYFVKGEKNDTHTLMDAALFHIPSRKMLFRASGINHIKSRATPINLSEQAREDSLSGFRQASMDLTKNLQEKLYNFRKMIRSSSGEFKLKLKPGYELEPLKSRE